MIYGIGIDLVNIKRLEKTMERWGDRFANRVFTPDERKFCHKRAYPASAFALRFAAKEAFSKALGLGMKRGIRWRDIEISHHPGGQPHLKLHGRSSDICREQKITSSHLSLSDEGEYGIAMVVLEKSDETGKSL
jgi:holo-[acyl-carrier protein] synthase